jgi:hypothetical protein
MLWRWVSETPAHLEVLQRSKTHGLMSPKGQSRCLWHSGGMSAVPPIAALAADIEIDSNGPISDIAPFPKSSHR